MSRAAWTLFAVAATAVGASALQPSRPTPTRFLPAKQASVVGQEVSVKPSEMAVEPFDLVRKDLRTLKRRIKALVENNIGANEKTNGGSTHPLVQEAAKGFMERRERAWRPAVVLLVARALATSRDKEVLDKHIQLAEIVEMMSTAQTIHDDVLEDFEEAEKGNVAHSMYNAELGNKVSLLAGDFLLARSSVELAKLVNTEVVEIMGTSLENMCRGEIMQAQAFAEDKLNTTYYLEQVSLKTASLLADACRCVCLLFGDEADSAAASAAWTLGLNMGIAYQVSKDIDVFNEAVSKGALTADSLMDMLALPPMAAVASETPRLAELAEQSFASDGDVDEALELVSEHGGIALALSMVQKHVEVASSAAQELPASSFRDGLVKMCAYVSETNQIGLQRKEYIELAKKASR